MKNNQIRLTLIKSAIQPDEQADQGKHTFTYSLFPHRGDWRHSAVVEQAYQLNAPLLATVIHGNPGGMLPGRFQFLDVDADHVMVETVKKAEEDRAWIVRVYEYKQIRSKVNLSFFKPIEKIVECNLIEEELWPLSHAGRQVTFRILPYEIKTFKVWF